MKHDRIECRPDIMLGKPVIKGTRIPVDLLLRKVAELAADKELLEAYPRLTVEDIRAALMYAADAIQHEDIVFADATPAAV